VAGQLVPVPNREAGVAPLDGPIQVVPMIEHPEFNFWTVRFFGFRFESLGLETPQPVKDAVQYSDGEIANDGVVAFSLKVDRSTPEAIISELSEGILLLKSEHLRKFLTGAKPKLGLCQSLCAEEWCFSDKFGSSESQFSFNDLVAGTFPKEIDAREKLGCLTFKRGIFDPLVVEPESVAVVSRCRKSYGDPKQYKQQGFHGFRFF